MARLSVGLSLSNLMKTSSQLRTLWDTITFKNFQIISEISRFLYACHGVHGPMFFLSNYMLSSKLT